MEQFYSFIHLKKYFETCFWKISNLMKLMTNGTYNCANVYLNTSIDRVEDVVAINKYIIPPPFLTS